jgi:hypothetical protein
MYKIFKSRFIKIVFLDLIVVVIFFKAGLIYRKFYASFISQEKHSNGVFVTKTTPVGQTFRIDSDGISIGKIGLFIDYTQWGKEEELVLNVWDSNLKNKLLGSKKLKNSGSYWVYAKFIPAIKVEKNKEYYFELTHNGGGDGQVGWIVCDENNPYHYGQMYVSNLAVKDGDLVFDIQSELVKLNYLGIVTLFLFFIFVHTKLWKLVGNGQDAVFMKIFLFFTIIYMLFLTDPFGSIVGDIYSGDDNSYYGYISSLVNDFDLDFSNNKLVGIEEVSPVTGKIISPHPIGTSILLMPFYIIIKPLVHLISWFTKTPFDQRHPLFFVFMCSGVVLYLYLGGLLLYNSISFLFSKKAALFSVILCVFGSILPVYAFKRPIMTHVPEFFLISLLLSLIIKLSLKIKSRDLVNIKYGQILLLGLINGGILITRWNDIHILFFTVFFILFVKTDFGNKGYLWKNRLINLTIFLVVVGVIFFLTQCQAWKYFGGSYFKLPYSLSNVRGSVFQTSILVHFKNILHIFIGLDWGILYTMFPVLVGLIWFLIYNPIKISKWEIVDRIVYFILFSIPFIIVLGWKTQASYYGYRYLLSLLPFCCVGIGSFVEYVLKKMSHNRILKIVFYLSIVILLLFNILLILPFEYAPGNMLACGISKMGGSGWVNNEYVMNAIKFYLSSPLRNNVFNRGFGGAYFRTNGKIFETEVGAIYPAIVILMIIFSHIVLRRTIKNETCNTDTLL